MLRHKRMIAWLTVVLAFGTTTWALAGWRMGSCSDCETWDNGDGTSTDCFLEWEVNDDFSYYNCGGLVTSKHCELRQE